MQNNNPSRHVIIPAQPHPDKVVQHRITTLKQLVDIALLFDPNNECWVYRGQSDSSWRLTTTLERDDNGDQDFGQRLSREQREIRKFRSFTRGRLNFGKETISWLSAMQHYGVKTRLLDFTRSFFIALFFASQETRKQANPKDFSVWCLNLKKTFDRAEAIESAARKDVESDLVKPDGMSSTVFEQTLEVGADAIKKFTYFDEDERISMLRTLANKMLAGTSEFRSGVIPVDLPDNNERILAQNGLFVLPANFESFESNLAETLEVERSSFGDNMECADIERIKALKMGNRLACVKFVIEGGLGEDVVKLLNAANITPRTVYPDISGIVPFVQ